MKFNKNIHQIVPYFAIVIAIWGLFIDRIVWGYQVPPVPVAVLVILVLAVLWYFAERIRAFRLQRPESARAAKSPEYVPGQLTTQFGLENNNPEAVEKTYEIADAESAGELPSPVELRESSTTLSRQSMTLTCASCGHQMDFARRGELEIYDYDLDSKNGIQVKCTKCGSVTTLPAELARR